MMIDKDVPLRATHIPPGGRTVLILNEKTLRDSLKDVLKENPDVFVSITDLMRGLSIRNIDERFWAKVEAFAIRNGLRWRYFPENYRCQFWEAKKDFEGQKTGQMRAWVG